MRRERQTEMLFDVLIFHSEVVDRELCAGLQARPVIQ